VIIDILQHLSIDKTEGGLYDPEIHIVIFAMFTFEQKNDVYDVIQYVAHFLTVNFLVKHLLLTLELLLFDYFDE